MRTLPALYHSGAAYFFQNRQDKVKEAHAVLSRIDAKIAQEFAKKFIKR